MIAIRSYRHCDDEVGLSLLEAAYFGHEERSQVRDECLDDKDNRDHSELSQLISGQLRREFGED